MKSAVVATAVLAMSAGALPALAEVAAPAVVTPPTAPAPRDVPYPGTIDLNVDLSDAARKIFHVHEAFPVQPGPLTLYYPKWIPGEHSPSGTIAGVTGIKFDGSGYTLKWRRDPIDMFAVHLDVPQGTYAVSLDFDFLSPDEGGDFGGSVSVTPKIVDLEWNQVAFYPAGYYSRRLQFVPSVKIPEGWKFATALTTALDNEGYTIFKPVSFENLVDSPLIAGEYFKRIDLAPGAKVPVFLDLVGDHAQDLEVKPEQIKPHIKLVEQANALFGAHHYEHYDFLFTLSDSTGHFGLEHHQSSDDRLDADFFTDPATYLIGAGLLPHEYVHSWNGKFRRPADLWTPTFNEPMQGDLLWVYEGLTTYLGDVLTARSGLWTPEQYRDALAETASAMSLRPGRSWRPLQDTADEAQILYSTPRAWSNWRRSVDFYPEGELIWLDVDTQIRELSKGKRTLDDFTQAFYGINDGSYVPVTYTFDDIVKTLNEVQAYDWAKFLRQRLDSTKVEAPLDGIARGGWQLVYTDTPSEYSKAAEKQRKRLDLMDSLGFIVGNGENKGHLGDVLWGGPAFTAGLAPGMTLVAVDGEAYDADRLKAAITAAKGAKQPIELLVKNLDYYFTVKLDYHDGLKYPHLQRVDATPDRLSAIVKAVAVKTAAGKGE